MFCKRSLYSFLYIKHIKGGIKTTIISGTYTDLDTVKDCYIVTELYDATELTANITAQAEEAKRWVNNFIGRTTDFTAAELAEIKNEPIVSAASRRVACTMQLKRQERTAIITEETHIDCAGAKDMLINWCHNNGIVPASEKKGKNIPIATKITIVTSEKEYTI